MTRNEKEGDRRWNEKYQQLKTYQKEHGDCAVPQGYEAAPNLARWVNAQRERLRQGTITAPRKKKLDSLGFWWGTSNKDRWTSNFEKLKDFKESHGHFHVPCNYPSDPGFPKWVTKQKALLRNNDLTLERENLLRDIGFPGEAPARGRKRKKLKTEAEEETEQAAPSKRPARLKDDSS